MSLLAEIHSPEDLRALNAESLVELCEEIRAFLVEKVAASGGHLGPNLGVVETSVALHRIFKSPIDPIIFDTGHQAYVHKMLTGRLDQFDTLREKDGLSGYPCRAESEHDVVESSHASSSLSYADGLAKAFELSGDTQRCVVAVVGDGAMTGGMVWEALNNIAAGKNRRLVIVVNDNGRSYAPTIGGLATRLSALRLQPAYEKAMDKTKRTLSGGTHPVSRATYSVLHGLKTGIKDAVSPQELFSDLGLKYMGPVDGHDVAMMESALRRAKEFGGPVIVHAVTQKGRGYVHAENDAAELMHATGKIDPVTGKSTSTSSSPSWTSVFSSELLELGKTRPDVVAITAAMPGPTGVAKFGEKYPDRLFDVGIAEQHAMTSAAGLALGGMHPIVAIYSTFLNRAFDQLLMDVALLKQPVTLVLDRAGITGPDGASHNGMWDFSLLGIIPGIVVAAPRDESTMRDAVRQAVTIDDGPSAIRFPKGALHEDFPVQQKLADGLDVLFQSDSLDHAPQVVVYAVGAMVGPSIEAARVLSQSINVTVVNSLWVMPVHAGLHPLAHDADLVVTVEDSGVHGGVGSKVHSALSLAGCSTPVVPLGVPQEFIDHASRDEIFEQVGLNAEGLAVSIADAVSRHTAS